MKVIAKNAPVVGVTFHPEGMKFLSDHADQAYLKMIPEPENEYDKNALAIYAVVKDVGKVQVGYLRKGLAKSINQNYDVDKVTVNVSKAFTYEGEITGLRVEVLLHDEHPTDVS